MNDAVNMAAHVAPKSDQLNADDLISGPRTITITRVRANGSNADQPVAIHFDGDNNKPYLACKSMRRVMVHVWGADTKIYVGRSMTLYCDPEVQFGGMKVGGIRISHMSHIDEPKSMPLTTTRARRALFTVQPLQRAAATTAQSAQKSTAPAAQPSAPTADEYAACADRAAFDVLEQRRADTWSTRTTAEKKALKTASDAAGARLRAATAPPASDIKLDGTTSERETQAIAALERAFKEGPARLAATFAQIESDYAARNEPIPLSIDAQHSELQESLKE